MTLGASPFISSMQPCFILVNRRMSIVCDAVDSIFLLSKVANVVAAAVPQTFLSKCSAICSWGLVRAGTTSAPPPTQPEIIERPDPDRSAVENVQSQEDTKKQLTAKISSHTATTSRNEAAQVFPESTHALRVNAAKTRPNLKTCFSLFKTQANTEPTSQSDVKTWNRY